MSLRPARELELEWLANTLDRGNISFEKRCFQVSYQHDHMKGPEVVCSTALRTSLASHIKHNSFACVGAKSALANDNLQIETAWSLNSAWNDNEIHEKLLKMDRAICC